MTGTTAHRSVIGRIKVSGTVTDPLFIKAVPFDFNKFGEVLATSAVTIETIVTATFATSSFEEVGLIRCAGTTYARWFFEVNGTVIESGPGEGYEKVFDFTNAPFTLISGDVVTVRKRQLSGNSHDFNATIYGYG